ncbi:hypothetical protein ACFZDJ_51535 [Streptomyces sp. NPDC007896]|uniref:hypothetical protein n=1 Tax=Streptomyces sp. NPDC007896 TaxID=3364784 RepID=UPI0036DFAA25
MYSARFLELVTAMGAVILHTKLGVSSPFVAGLAPFLMFGWSAAGLLILWRLNLARMLVTGAIVFPAGLAPVALLLVHPSLWLYLVAVSIAGLGAGALRRGWRWRTANRRSSPRR